MYPTIDIGFLQIPSFFVVLSFLMGLAFFMTTRRSRHLNLDEKFSLDLALVLAIGGVVGARLTHIIFENPEYYYQNPVKMLFFWEGGFVFFGGFILSFLSGLGFLYLKEKRPFLKLYMQLYTPILSLVYMLGRIGCFLEGCCYGKYCELPWSVNGRHPTQIYSSLWELGVFIVLLAYEAKNETVLRKNPERLFYIWLFLHSIGRGSIESLRDDFRGDMPLLSLSAWISLCFIGIAIVYFYRNRRSAILSKPGTK